ncbi:unnamed protein product, partial [Sphacelaria rigidula]
QVAAWDTSARGVRELYSEGRSYISCISEVPTGDECRGEEKDMGECRMVRNTSNLALVIRFCPR